jgi:hypothetical protein
MRKLGAVFVLLAGCSPAGRPWESRVQEPDLPPPPPEHLLRQPPDFRIRDVPGRKEYYLFFYEDESVRQQIVTVIDHSLPEDERTQRLATLEEHNHAIGAFIAHWKEIGDEARLRYFNDVQTQEARRNATLLDPQILLKREAFQSLRDQKHGLVSDLKSRKDTGAFPEGSEKLNLAPIAALEREIVKKEALIRLTEAQLTLLEYKQKLRDQEYALRSASLYQESRFAVDDIVPRYSSAERLMDDVRTHTRPEAWLQPLARLEYADGHLVLRQTPDVTEQVRSYLDRLRTEFARARPEPR